MKKAFIAFGLAISLVSCTEKFTLNGKDLSWAQDTSRAIVVSGSNYTMIIDKNASTNIKAPIPIDLAVAMARQHEAVTRDLIPNRTFSVEFDKDEFFQYMSTVQDLSDVRGFRVYNGVYPDGHQDQNGRPNGGRFSGILVAVGRDGKEKYSGQTIGLQMINVGTLCPTNCPEDDNRSLYRLAQLPAQ